MSYNLNGYPIIITVKKEKLKRVAVISSNILIQNLTSLPFELSIVSQGQLNQPFQIPPDDQKYPIDFNKVDSSILLKLGDATSQAIDLSSLNKSKSHYINIPMTSASSQYNNIVLDVYTKRLVTFVDIKPALIVSNLCPVPVHFAMTCRDKEFAQLVFRSDPVEVFLFDPYKEQTNVKFVVNDDFTTSFDLTKFLNKESKRSITLSDSKNSELNIHIDLEHNRFLNKITIYSKFNIFNETGLDLEFNSFNPSIAGHSHKLVGNGTNTVLFQSQKSHSTFMIKANPKTFESVKEFPVDLLPSIRGSTFFPKNISYNLNEKITGGSGATFYEYGLSIMPSVVRLPSNTYTKTITVSPQYVVVNNTQYTLRILQEAGHCAEVSSFSRLPVVWRQPEKRLAFEVVHEQNS